MIACKDIPLKSWAMLQTAGIGFKSCELGGLISSGNTKLPNTTCIFNMDSAHNCPSRKLGLCKAAKQGANCYALKAEYSYHPDVLPYREKQAKFWKTVTAKEFVSQFLLINAMKRIAFTAIRFNEAGDFHNQAELEKAEEIALHLRRFGIRCYCYTSRSDLNFAKIRHLIVAGSNFKKAGISNVFRIVRDEKKERKKGESICKGDCRICRYCQMRNMKIIIKKH